MAGSNSAAAKKKIAQKKALAKKKAEAQKKALAKKKADAQKLAAKKKAEAQKKALAKKKADAQKAEAKKRALAKKAAEAARRQAQREREAERRRKAQERKREMAAKAKAKMIEAKEKAKERARIAAERAAAKAAKEAERIAAREAKERARLEAIAAKEAAREAELRARRKPEPPPKPPIVMGPKVDGIQTTSKFDFDFLKSQRDLLLEMRAQLTTQASRLEDEANALIEDVEMGDVQFDEEGGEGDTMVVERERDLVLSAQARHEVEEIDAALERIKSGEYGYSIHSGLPIPRERLKAIPWTQESVQERVGGLARR